MEKILIFDFGSQTTQLIARRVRETGVYTETIPGDTSAEKIDFSDVKGLIFSGSPSSVYEEGAPVADKMLYDLGLPILGICYGMHRIIVDFSGKVERLETREFGRAPVLVREENPLLSEIPDTFTSWMSHGDSILQLPESFRLIAASDKYPAVVYNQQHRIYGFQFHPEVSHCEFGKELLGNFAHAVCGCGSEWTIENYIQQVSSELRSTIGRKNVLLLISGGVDSTVAAGLLLAALPASQIHLMYIDTGLMRKNETAEVRKNLEQLGAENLHIIDASADFLGALRTVEDPEKKRRIIGDMFIKIQEREVEKLEIPGAVLVQGTLYTDLIESGKGVGKNAHVIKSHHNVRTPLIEEKRKLGLVIEPLDRLYKDEVRELGKNLGISETIVGRHPFPGPGLAVRILGEVTQEKCRILKDADAVYINELKERQLYDEIWQAFSVLLPVRSVGVTGDARNYNWVLALRAVISSDGMTADVYPFPSTDLLEISSIITNTIPEIGRVVYDISSKPPATIEWE